MVRLRAGKGESQRLERGEEEDEEEEEGERNAAHTWIPLADAKMTSDSSGMLLK